MYQEIELTVKYRSIEEKNWSTNPNLLNFVGIITIKFSKF